MKRQSTMLVALTFAACVAATAVVAQDAVTILTGHEDKVTCVAISPDGKRALSTSDDRTVREWDLVKGKELRILPKEHKDYTLAAVYVGGNDEALTSGGGLWKGRHFGLGSDFVLRLWNLSDAAKVRTLAGHAGPVWSIAVSKDGKTAITGSGGWTDPTSAQPQPKGHGAFVWDLESGNHRELKGHQHWVQSVAIGGLDVVGVTGSWDKVVRLWNLPEATLLREFKGHTEMVNSVAISDDGYWILSGSGAGKIFLWNVTTGKKSKELKGHTKRVWSVAFAEKSATAVSASADGTIRLWDIAQGKELRVFKGHTDEVRRAVFSPDEQHILTGSHDKTVRWWRLDKGE